MGRTTHIPYPKGLRCSFLFLSSIIVSPDRLLQFLLVLICVYCVASIFLKSSLLAFYLRIFRPKRVPRITIWVSLWLIIIFYLTLAIYSPAVCHSWGTSLPSSGDSDVSGLLPVPNITQIVEEGSPDAIQEAINLITQSVVAAADVTPCKRTQLDVSVAGGIFSAVTDIYFLLLPVWLIADLRLPVKRKIGICAVFLIGVLSVFTLHSVKAQRLILFKKSLRLFRHWRIHSRSLPPSKWYHQTIRPHSTIGVGHIKLPSR